MTWWIAFVISSIPCHQVLPRTRAEVWSEPTTGLVRTAAAIGVVAASSGASVRTRILALAPSLIVRPNTSSVRRDRRRKLTARATLPKVPPAQPVERQRRGCADAGSAS
jgi:hypothetical protein